MVREFQQEIYKEEIRYSIIKNQNLNKNKYSDKSSMDGSVDEIITKKLQDFYKRDKKYSQRINDIAMNKKHLDIENEYIDSLEKEMQKIGIKNDEQTKLLEGMKEKNRIFKEVNEISEEDIFKLDDCKIASKLGIEIPMIKSITPG